MQPGVYIASKKDGTLYYRSNITFRGKHISLGSFSTEEEAHSAYMQAGEILSSKDRHLEEIFNASDTLSFEKKVILFNFRDKGVYIKNPIYLRKNFFSYYISPALELKFDLDDLFYYSSHRIMKRQGHYFVNDYGMQVSILTRFGIPPYAVAGRDYRFVNGDDTDLRYANIELINPYHGVTSIRSEKSTLFKTRLHINGNWVIGIYPTLFEAAVAYNKAIDLAKDAGVSREYTPNYLTDLSAREYASIYSDVTVSEKFLKYLSTFR